MGEMLRDACGGRSYLYLQKSFANMASPRRLSATPEFDYLIMGLAQCVKPMMVIN
jgi:hypothetical protein